ncbi:ubiquitin carboxyl-terminal hydrolase 47-like isoform X2 [Chiloscyllium plagiosum]|uniref:ubiquitin carboxyl-terminal hydrolase 47-like isoform X2 n=1 Tax=Chiloscyllium plagiosum TaxID=36176 RepID=UPI001CB7B879|nr:ubiquitin carboxyl-terminal hydrolase 47-like isoform X2 [Chiloscyllium plagiosum]
MQNSSHNCKPGRESFNLFKKLIKFIMSGMAGSHEEYFGLYNQGATCYLNTLLQTLYMTPEVKDTIDRFVGETYEPIDKDASICYQLKELFANLENDPAHTHGITRTLGLSKKVFEQQDVEEYFRLLLNKIDEESNGSCNVLQIYQSKVINSLKCLECDTESQEECKLLDIPLSLSPPDYMKREYFNSVNESLEDFLKDTILSRDNLCYCERCEKKTETKTVRDTDKTEWCLLPDETGVTAMTKATQLKPGSSHGNDVSNASWNPQEDNDQEVRSTQHGN